MSLIHNSVTESNDPVSCLRCRLSPVVLRFPFPNNLAYVFAPLGFPRSDGGFGEERESG